jgi:undecaprenyl-diphosphatase
MQELVLQFDYRWFVLLNQAWTWDIFDLVMPYWRDKWTWLPLYTLLLTYLLLRMRPVAPQLLLAIAVTTTGSEALSSHLVKPAVERPRPCHLSSPVSSRILIACGTAYSFPSSHATNHMALAVLLSLALRNHLRRARWWLIPWAVSIGYAQIYVGVHFPLDILSGFALGAATGAVGFCIYSRSRREHDVQSGD